MEIRKLIAKESDAIIAEIIPSLNRRNKESKKKKRHKGSARKEKPWRIISVKLIAKKTVKSDPVTEKNLREMA